MKKTEKLGNKSTFLKDLSCSRMVVITANHTTYLETLAANYPTLIYWVPEANVYKEYQNKYFDILIKAEILHLNPISAAKKLNKVFLNPNEWWAKAEVQYARNEFCSNLAITDDNFLEIYKNEIKNSFSK